MSDFDKEAEREKLREKYERDQQERQATQRMSDLLLKGATMTNAHCGTCGDPLFQLDGTTFCPSCHGNPDAVEGTGLEAQSADESTAEGAAETPADGAEPSASSDAGGRSEPVEADATNPPNATRPDQQPQRGQNGESIDASESAASSGTDDVSADATPSATDEEPARSTGADAEPAGRSTDDRQFRNEAGRAGGAGRSAEGDLEAAHDSLVAALEKFAAKAAATDDPRYAKECLEAAREAGETLETLR